MHAEDEATSAAYIEDEDSDALQGDERNRPGDPFDIRGNLKSSSAAFMGFVVALVALLGLILCFTLPWISYEGERQVYDEDDDEYRTESEEVSMKYDEFHEKDNMDRMRWNNSMFMDSSDSGPDFYKSSAGWAINGFIFLAAVGMVVYLLAVYQHSETCEMILGYFPESMSDGQKRLFALQMLSSLIVLISILSLRAVSRFLQLQLVYNHNSEVMDVNETVFAGWASVGVIATAGTALLFGLFTLYSTLKAGWTMQISVNDGEADYDSEEQDSRNRLSKKYGTISFAIVVVAMTGIIVSLLLPTLSITIMQSDSDQETELLVDDGTIHTWNEYDWIMFNLFGFNTKGVDEEIESWHTASSYNRIGFEYILFFGLIATFGVSLLNSGNDKEFLFLFWVPVIFITLASIVIFFLNLFWIMGSGDLGEELTDFLDFATIEVESDFVYNYYPLMLSAGLSIALPALIFMNREEIARGSFSGKKDDEAGYASETRWYPARDVSLPELNKRHITASLCVLFLMAGAFGAFVPGMELGGGGSGAGSGVGTQWYPQHVFGTYHDGHLDEQTSETVPVDIYNDYIFYITFILTWEDEPDEPMCTNEPDNFRLTVETPWGEEKFSDWESNEHGEEGRIEILFSIEGDPGPMGSEGTWNATVECGECGDQWYTNPHTIGYEDSGNDYTLSLDYTYWEEM